MELAGGKRDVVEPIVRAKISSLVSALGGSGAEEDGRYVLGDEALECLRDLKRWINYYDKQKNTLDVVRCLAETNVVEGDLLPILATWLESAPQKGFKSKIAMACVELLVHLTFPLEADVHTMTVNHHRHIPFLQKAQLGYKRSIIGYDKARILHTAVRCALPSMAEAIGDRSPRDEGIIRIVLYFLRNIVMITPPPSTNADETEISRSATIGALQYQDIFPLLLTVSSTMGEDFNTQDVVILEILFHLIKGVNIEKLFMDEAKADRSMGEELVRLRRKEQAMLDSYKVNAPSRHNRFGTMAWMQRGDGKMTTVTGQAAMLDSTRTLAKMDATKRFKPPRRAVKGDDGPMDFDTPNTLNPQADRHLRAFVEDFLDSGFNPLFNHLRKAIDRQAARVDSNHQRQFFYLVSWFLEAERQRRKSKKSAKMSKSAVPIEIDSFSLVASVLNQEMFVTLNRAMDSTLENKLWQDLSAAMKCFTQILLTVQDMSESPLEEDQEIAENVLNRIFYEETTHDRVATITRTYKDQGFGYLDSSTELTHNYLRILEQYSKQNVDLQVRSRRRTRRKKKVAREAGEDGPDDDIVDESDAEDERRAETTTRERNFDFKKFAAKFVTQGCVDTFVTFTSFYNELTPHQLKRSHRFFYRVAFKQEMSVMLFRVDIIALLYRMIKGPEGLDPQASCFKEWEELVKQILKKCTRKIQERPELIVEMLFSKINSTAHYLEYGYEKQTSLARPRAPAELEVKGGKEWEEQVAIVVGAMLDRNESDYLQWAKSQLYSAEIERRIWEGAKAAAISTEQAPTADGEVQTSMEAESLQAPSILVTADNSTRKIAMFKNGHLRLLMTLIGFRPIGEHDDPEGSWVMPSSLSADQLKQSLDLIKKYEHIPPTFDDGQEAGDFIRRTSAGAARQKAAFDDDDGIENDTDEELFPVGGPTPMSKKDAMQALKKTRRIRRKGTESADEDGLTDEVLKARAEARRLKELEKNRKIKSSLHIHESDEESDEERDKTFFAQEEKIRQRSHVTIMKALGKEKETPTYTKKQSNKKRQSSILSDSDDVVMTSNRKRQSSVLSDNSDDDEPASRRGRSSSTARDAVSGNSDHELATDTPISSPYARPSKTKKRKVVRESEAEASAPARSASPEVVETRTMVLDVDADADAEEEEEEEEEDVPVLKSTRQRRAGFIVDSSDDEE